MSPKRVIIRRLEFGNTVCCRRSAWKKRWEGKRAKGEGIVSRRFPVCPFLPLEASPSRSCLTGPNRDDESIARERGRVTIKSFYITWQVSKTPSAWKASKLVLETLQSKYHMERWEFSKDAPRWSAGSIERSIRHDRRGRFLPTISIVLSRGIVQAYDWSNDIAILFPFSTQFLSRPLSSSRLFDFALFILLYLTSFGLVTDLWLLITLLYVTWKQETEPCVSKPFAYRNFCR